MTAGIAGREAWLRKTLEGLGYELVDLESSRGGLLRVFIDQPSGISVDEDGRVYMVDQWFRKIDVFRPATLKAEDGFLARRNAAPAR